MYQLRTDAQTFTITEEHKSKLQQFEKQLSLAVQVYDALDEKVLNAIDQFHGNYHYSNQLHEVLGDIRHALKQMQPLSEGHVNNKNTTLEKDDPTFLSNNKIQLIGYLSSNPEIRTIGDEKKHARFTVATEDTCRDGQGEEVKNTQWHHVVTQEMSVVDIAEKFLKKDSKVVIVGKLANRSYTDKNGIKRDITEIEANEVHKVGDKSPE